MTTYLDRDDARGVLLNELGVRIGKNGLANLASDGAGPAYVLINGRALYTRDGLIDWVKQQASRPRQKRSRSLSA